MTATIVKINGKLIRDEASFHKIFAKEFGFPDCYGENLNAWQDCMEYLDEDDGMTKIKVEKGGIIALYIENSAEFYERCPELFQRFLNVCGSINEGRVAIGKPPTIALAYDTRR